MNIFIQFIKKMFSKKMLVLDEGKSLENKENINNKEIFLNSIKTENGNNDILLIQRKLENDLIDESKLTNEEITKVKELYYGQIFDLMDSIKKYKLKLNEVQ